RHDDGVDDGSGPQRRQAGDRAGPAEPDGRVAGGWASDGTRVALIHRHVPDSVRARDDDLRTGPTVQPGVWDRGRSPGGTDARMEPADALGRHRPPVGQPVSWSAD